MTRGRVFALTGLAMIAVVFMNPGTRWANLNAYDTIFGRWHEKSELDGTSVDDGPHSVKDSEPVEKAGTHDSFISRVKAMAIADGSVGAMSYVIRTTPSNVFMEPHAPPPPRKDYTNSLRVSRETLLWAAKEGVRLEPNNSFFCLSLAVALEAMGRSDEALLELGRISQCTTYQMHYEWEMQRRIEVFEASHGYRGEFVRLMCAGWIMMPQFAAFKQLSKRPAVQQSLAARLNMVRFAVQMSDHGQSAIDLYVARSIARQAIEGEVENPKSGTPETVDRSLLLAQRFAHRTNQPWVARDIERVYRRVWPHIGLSSLANTGDVFRPHTTSRLLSSSLLVALVGAVLTLSIGLLGRKSGLVGSGAIPHVIAAVAWIYVLSVVGQPEGAPPTILILSALHLFLAFQYGSGLASLAGAALWFVCAAVLLLSIDGMLFEPLLYISLISSLVLRSHPQPNRSRLAALAGLGIAITSLLLGLGALAAVVPGVAYLVSRSLQRIYICDNSILGIPILGAVLALLGYGVVQLSAYNSGVLLQALLLAVGTAFAIALLLRPFERPARVGAVFLLLSIAYVGSVGYQSMLNAHLKGTPTFFNEGDQIRRMRDR